MIWSLHIFLLLRANKINFIIFLCDETLFYTIRLDNIVLRQIRFIWVIIQFKWYIGKNKGTRGKHCLIFCIKCRRDGWKLAHFLNDSTTLTFWMNRWMKDTMKTKRWKWNVRYSSQFPHSQNNDLIFFLFENNKEFSLIVFLFWYNQSKQHFMNKYIM